MKTNPEDFPQEIVPSLISYLKTLQRKGIRSIYLGDSPTSEASESHNSEAPGRENRMDNQASSATVAEQLLELDAQVKSCTECDLHRGRKNTVFGKGNPAAGVMFIGEGPGREEDLKGEPFVGRSGQLLTKMIAAIGLERADVYITNIVKCRPPENRDPQESEVRCCERYLAVQIGLIKPRIICLLSRNTRPRDISPRRVVEKPEFQERRVGRL
jgi:DNA polymerase